MRMLLAALVVALLTGYQQPARAGGAAAAIAHLDEKASCRYLVKLYSDANTAAIKGSEVVDNPYLRPGAFRAAQEANDEYFAALNVAKAKFPKFKCPELKEQ